MNYVSSPITYEITRIKDTIERDREEREAQHRQTLERLRRQKETVFKTLFAHRKRAYEKANTGQHYEMTSLGKAGWQTEEARKAMVQTFSADEQKQYQQACSQIMADTERENESYASDKAEMLERLTDDRLIIDRTLKEKTAMLDNLIELIVFTRCGSFNADPDFGFEYWNYEYSNVIDDIFNKDNAENGAKYRCQESIRRSLQTYAPELTGVRVEMKLDSPQHPGGNSDGKIISLHRVTVAVEVLLDAGISTFTKYRKDVEFLMEPMAKHSSL